MCARILSVDVDTISDLHIHPLHLFNVRTSEQWCPSDDMKCMFVTLFSWSWLVSEGARVWMVKGGVTGVAESRLITLLEGTLSYSTGHTWEWSFGIDHRSQSIWTSTIYLVSVMQHLRLVKVHFRVDHDVLKKLKVVIRFLTSLTMTRFTRTGGLIGDVTTWSYSW